jgi:enamine deaminase RidA (YjgF/YER057c/UK114 family)
MGVEHLNPEGLIQNPGFTHAIAVSGPHKVIYVGGQNAVDVGRNIVGKGDIKAQTHQVFRNLEVALAAGGATIEDVVKWNVFVVHGQSGHEGFQAFQETWGDRPNPPTISVLYVAALAHPDFLVEVNAVAVVLTGSG